MREVICEKIGMSSIFSKQGELIPVTFLKLIPLQVLTLKKKDEFGYNSLLLGVGSECSPKKLTKPVQGQFQKKGLPLRPKLKEVSWDGQKEYKTGDFLKIEELFQLGEKIKVQGISRGMGFTGAIKRWNFATSPKTHGSGYPHRFQGSLETGRGGRSPQKVWKGKKMSGHSGSATRTVQNLKIVHINSEKGILAVHGSVPGRKKSLIRVKSIHKPKSISPIELAGIN